MSFYQCNHIKSRLNLNYWYCLSSYKNLKLCKNYYRNISYWFIINSSLIIRFGIMLISMLKDIKLTLNRKSIEKLINCLFFCTYYTLTYSCIFFTLGLAVFWSFRTVLWLFRTLLSISKWKASCLIRLIDYD